MQQSQQHKFLIIGGTKVDEKVVKTLLNYEQVTFRQIFENISPMINELCKTSNVLKKEDPVINQIENGVKISLEYVSLFEKSLVPIPCGLSYTELMNNEVVKERNLSRSRLKNMYITGFIQVLANVAHNMEEIVKLHNNPNILNKETKIDTTDLSILMNKSVILSDFERRSMYVSVGDVTTKSNADGHGSLSSIFARKKDNIEDKNALVKFEQLYDDVQNIFSLAEDLLITDPFIDL